MKTTQMMLRKIGGIEFHQNHKTAMINATEFLENLRSLQVVENEGDSKTTPEVVLKTSRKSTTLEWYWFHKNEQTQSYLAALSRSEGIPIDELVISKKGRYGGTHVHPLVFIELCRWVSPDFSVAANKMVVDGLLGLRESAGDLYKQMTSAIANAFPYINSKGYAEIASHLNQLIFNSRLANQRNYAGTEELKLMNDLQSYIIDICLDGDVNSINQLKEKITNKYSRMLKNLELKYQD